MNPGNKAQEIYHRGVVRNCSAVERIVYDSIPIVSGGQVENFTSPYDIVVHGHEIVLKNVKEEVEKISSGLWNNLSTHVLLEGATGVGKTTVIKRMIHNYHLRCPDVKILYLDLSNAKVLEAITWPEDLLSIDGHLNEQCQAELECSDGKNYLVFLDNFTDIPQRKNCIIRKILDGKILQQCKKVISCRSQYAENALSIIEVDHQYKVKGLAVDELESFFKTQSKYSETVIMPYLKQNHLYQMCTNPLVGYCVLSVFKQLKYQIPKTLTDFLYRLTCELVSYEFNVEERTVRIPSRHVQLESLPDSVKATFEPICHLAMKHIQKGHECVNIDESRQFLSSFSLQHLITTTEMFRFGLAEMSTDKETSKQAYKFLCPNMAEFLAAFHLYMQPPLNQLYFIHKHSLSLFKGGYRKWLQFFFGLVGRNYVSDETQHNLTKLMMNSIIDVLVHSLRLDQEPDYRYHLVECIHELQESSLFRKLSTKHQVILNFSVQGKLDTCVQPISSLINRCRFTVWNVRTSYDNKNYIDKLQEKLQGKSISVTLDSANKEVMSVSPQRSPSEVAKMHREMDSTKHLLSGVEEAEKFSRFYCHAAREILQRIFSMYSEVKLKGDASNSSYVSFLTCGCFEESFKSHVKLYPSQPVHFLPGPKKDFSKLSIESLSLTDRHNLSRHKGESMEVVIMLQPLLQKVEGSIPGTDNTFCLILSKDLTLDFSDNIESDLVDFERCVEDYKVNGAQTEQLLPILPIVKKTIYGRSQTAYPQPFFPPAQEPKPSPTIHIANETTVNTLQDDSCGRSGSNSMNHIGPPAGSKVMVAVNNGQVPSCNPYKHSPAQALGTTSIHPSQGVFVQRFTEQASGQARVHPATSRKQTAVKPGTVLFTSIPEIPSDQIQPLPQQHTLIRKGGNGSIFSENVCGLTLAVKKTSYRLKEYNIITKIRHKNIIPLLAYVWGEEHQENRRRHFVYHYLPKLSGDLARLVTDKHELCLYEFHKVHQNNLRAMGVAVGNVKYVLTQVLQGLQYLHRAHIAHRDLKASNVLVKFFCSCSSPLECACNVKYQVVLCDFDAAIELDSNDCIPPTPPLSHHMTGSPSFEIVPVGTNGFRSPESSMHTVANTPEAFSPPLTTKTDIYSFGIFCLRLMISTDTPYSQRAMAVLLLHYHQLKGGCEGRIGLDLSPHQKLDHESVQLLAGRKWLNYLTVDEHTTHRSLKLNKLKSKMSWLRGGYEFVRQCLSVNPETRPAAGDLLTHPFLN